MKKSVMTAFLLKVANVSGVMNSLASGVINTLISASSFTRSRMSMAALNAAILPVTPTSIFLLWSIDLALYDSGLRKYI